MQLYVHNLIYICVQIPLPQTSISVHMYMVISTHLYIYIYMFIHKFTWLIHTRSTNLRSCCLGRIMSHVWMSHVTGMHESCLSYKWVMSHVWLRHVTIKRSRVKRMDGSRPKYDSVMSLSLSSRHLAQCESCHTHEQVMSHIQRGHVTRMNQSCPLLLVSTSFFLEWMSHVTHSKESCPTYVLSLRSRPVAAWRKNRLLFTHNHKNTHHTFFCIYASWLDIIVWK